jgi:hypothetical protein
MATTATTTATMTLEVAATSGTAVTTIVIGVTTEISTTIADNFKGKRARDDDGEVNTVKKFGGRRNYKEDYAKALKGP